MELNSGIALTQDPGTEGRFWPSVSCEAVMDDWPQARAERVAQRLKAIVDWTGKSQSAFAESVGMSRQRLNDAIKGVVRLSLDNAIKICAVYHVSLDYIYVGNMDKLPYRFVRFLEDNDLSGI